MEEKSVEEVVTNTLIDYAKMRSDESDPEAKKRVDGYAMRVINENIVGSGAQKDFWIDYIIYTRAITR